MRKVFLLILPLLFFFYSCNKRINAQYEINEQVEFNPGFNFLDMFCGFYNENGKEYVYFTDPKTEKCIKRFSIEGEFIDSIPLLNVLNDTHYEIFQIAIYSTDTIILVTTPYGETYHINHNGEIINKLKNPENYIEDTMKYKMIFVPSFYSNPTNSSDILLFRLWYDYDDVVIENNLINENISTQEFIVCEEYYKLPYLIKVKGFTTDEIKIIFEPQKLNKDLYGDINGQYNGAMLDAANNFRFVGNDLFLLSVNSDYIYILDGENLNIIDKIKVKSDCTDIGAEPLILTSGEADTINWRKYNENSNRRFIAGILENIFYNEKTKEYYVIVSHKLSSREECESYGPYGEYRPFSIIIYDKDFKHSREYAFDGNKYNNKVSFLTDRGFMVLRKNEDTQDYGKSVFDFVSFN